MLIAHAGRGSLGGAVPERETGIHTVNNRSRKYFVKDE
jgi:hypothetical protein